MNMSIAKFTSSLMSVFETPPSRTGRLTSRGQTHKVEILRNNPSKISKEDENTSWYKDPLTVGLVASTALVILYAAHRAYSYVNETNDYTGSYGGYDGYERSYGGGSEPINPLPVTPIPRTNLFEFENNPICFLDEAPQVVESFISEDLSNEDFLKGLEQTIGNLIKINEEVKSRL